MRTCKKLNRNIVDTELSQREQALTDRIGALEREVAVLKADNELLRRGKEPSAKTPGLSERCNIYHHD